TGAFLAASRRGGAPHAAGTFSNAGFRGRRPGISGKEATAMAFTGRMKNMEKASCDIGLIGLAVMGQNLVLNMNDHGYKVAVFNRTVSKVDDFIQHEAKG